jgi:ribosomal protein L11 methyltransferase
MRDAAAVIRVLFEAGAEGVQELESEVVTSLAHVSCDEVARAIGRVDAGAAVSCSPTPDVDWSNAWKERIGAHQLGPLVVSPPWLADGFPPASRVVIDPGMAFGTGEHETTRGVIRLMPRVLRAGDVVADLGAGSGILSIAAARLGAARVAAIELDPDAIGNAEENVRLNGVADRVSIIEGDADSLLALIAPVDLILANIISSVLLALLPSIEAGLAPDGRAILSGMLADERPAMERAFIASGWRVDADDREGAWWSVAISRA